MQTLKLIFAFLFIGSTSYSQHTSNSIATNRLTTFNVANAGLDENQINFVGSLNKRLRLNNNFLIETKLGNSNFGLAAEISNSSYTLGYSTRKQLGLSYKFNLNNGKYLSLGAGFGIKKSTYHSDFNENYFVNNHYRVAKLGAIYASDRFKLGLELETNGSRISNSRYTTFSLIYQHKIIERANFDLTGNMVLANFNSSFELDMGLYNKINVITGYGSARGIYAGVGYKFTDNFAVNISTSFFEPQYRGSTLQFGLKFGF